ncbi:MAG: HAD family hydrolase [Bdellovibrionota bacterium]|jgi:phosphoglycolate phosphatase
MNGQRHTFDSLIFDLDGTLWDCSRAVVFAFNKVYKDFGIDKCVSEVFVRNLYSLPFSEYSHILTEGAPDDLKDALLSKLLEAGDAAVTEHPQAALYDGVSDGLTDLSTLYPLFLVSNCGIEYLNLFLKTSTVGHLFKDVLCHGHNKKSKAENIRTIVERNRLTAPCYIGDSSSDKSAATTVGVPFFYAAYGACFPSIANISDIEVHSFESFFDITHFFKQH